MQLTDFLFLFAFLPAALICAALTGNRPHARNALLLAMTIVVMTAVWSVARMGFESYTALHFVLGAMAIAAAVLACTVWKKRGRPICFGIAAAGAALAIARLASMLGYLVDLWSTSREYADGGDWPIVWESTGTWLRHDWPYYLFYLALIAGGIFLARRLKKKEKANDDL